MLKDFLLKVIADPVDKSALEFLLGESTLKNKNSGTVYSIKEDVPVLLPDIKQSRKTDLHNQFHSEFNYAEHYQNDTANFDYFKEDESAATRNERSRSREAIISKVDKQYELLLDVGCGSGWVAKHFLQQGKKVLSMDISTSNPVRVLKEYPHANHAAITADVFYLPLLKESVDCIIAAEVIEHVYDPALFIEKLLEVLKPGGKLILLTPYNEKIKYQLCVHCNRPTPESAHLHSFSEKNLGSFLPAKGISWQADKFMNKYFIKLRIYNLLSFFPFALWKLTDRIANAIFKKPSLFLIEITKD